MFGRCNFFLFEGRLGINEISSLQHSEFKKSSDLSVEFITYPSLVIESFPISTREYCFAPATTVLVSDRGSFFNMSLLG